MSEVAKYELCRDFVMVRNRYMYSISPSGTHASGQLKPA